MLPVDLRVASWLRVYAVDELIDGDGDIEHEENYSAVF
jgi:hypothetical protein